MTNPTVAVIVSFLPQKHAEFERLTSIEYPHLSLAKTQSGEYESAETGKLWMFWLQAYGAGKEGLIERPDELLP
jgi:hypothetical protein